MHDRPVQRSLHGRNRCIVREWYVCVRYVCVRVNDGGQTCAEISTRAEQVHRA